MTDARPMVPAIPGVPVDQDGPGFREPWEARVLAMTVALHEAGLFAWRDWASVLGGEIAKTEPAGDPDIGESTYYQWLVALEKMAAQKGLADSALQAHYREAWSSASRRTPHGSPIELQASDFNDP